MLFIVFRTRNRYAVAQDMSKISSRYFDQCDLGMASLRTILFFFHVFKSFCTSTSLCANFTIHRGKKNQRGHLGRFPRFFGTKVLGKRVNMSDLRVSSGGQANVAISPVHPFRLATATGIRPKILQINHSISQTFLEFPKKLAVGSCQKK